MTGSEEAIGALQVPARERPALARVAATLLAVGYLALAGLAFAWSPLGDGLPAVAAVAAGVAIGCALLALLAAIARGVGRAGDPRGSYRSRLTSLPVLAVAAALATAVVAIELATDQGPSLAGEAPAAEPAARARAAVPPSAGIDSAARAEFVQWYSSWSQTIDPMASAIAAQKTFVGLLGRDPSGPAALRQARETRQWMRAWVSALKGLQAPGPAYERINRRLVRAVRMLGVKAYDDYVAALQRGDQSLLQDGDRLRAHGRRELVAAMDRVDAIYEHLGATRKLSEAAGIGAAVARIRQIEREQAGS